MATVENVWASYKPVTGSSPAPITKTSLPSGPASTSWYPPRPAGRFQFDRRTGERRDKLIWSQNDNMEITPVNKSFNVESPEVAARTEEMCEQLRAKHSILVKWANCEGGGWGLPKPVKSFDEAPFPDWVLPSLKAKGFNEPRPIQMQAWTVLLSGHDLIGIAETGSGKTLAYVLPMLVHTISQEEVRPREGPIGLVLVPTRELALQIEKEVNYFAQHTGLVCRSIMGGDDFEKHRAWGYERMDVVVATPGRLCDMLDARATNLRRTTFIVIDEADVMLFDNFLEQVQMICDFARPDRQVALFSATWPQDMDALAPKVCNQAPVQINVGDISLRACSSILQVFSHIVEGTTKEMTLIDTIRDLTSRLKGGEKMLVFCNQKTTVHEVLQHLANAEPPLDVNWEAIYGDLTQRNRDSVLKRFTSDQTGDLPVLVCTQILGRGHDFQDVRFVVNYDMPRQIVEYIHRIGRTGRAGAKGNALTFLDDADLFHQAKALSACLQESSQQVDPWITKATKYPWRRDYQDRFWRQKQGVAEGWDGRGQGRRHEFLEKCEGRGPAFPSQVASALETQSAAAGHVAGGGG